MAYFILTFSINMQITPHPREKAIYAPYKQHFQLPKRGSFQQEIAFPAPNNPTPISHWTVKKTIDWQYFPEKFSNCKIKTVETFKDKESTREHLGGKCVWVLKY